MIFTPEEDTIPMPRHWLQNIWAAAQTLQQSDSLLDRREGEALEKMYCELEKK